MLIGILSRGPLSSPLVSLSRQGFCQLLPAILMGLFSCCQAQTNLPFIQNWMRDQPGKNPAASFIKVSHYLSCLCLLCVSLDYNYSSFCMGKEG